MKNSSISFPQIACGTATVFLGTTLSFLTLTFTGGCGSEAGKKLAAGTKAAAAGVVKSATEQVTDSVQNAARPTATSFVFNIENVKEPLKVTSGKAEVAVLESRPIAVNFSSSAGRDAAAFPNVLVCIQGKGKSFAELVGKTHPARIMIRMRPAQAMYITQSDKPAQVTIEAGDDTFVTAKFEKAELFDSSGQDTAILSGKLTGLIPQPPKPPADKKADDKKKAGEK